VHSAAKTLIKRTNCDAVGVLVSIVVAGAESTCIAVLNNFLVAVVVTDARSALMEAYSTSELNGVEAVFTKAVPHALFAPEALLFGVWVGLPGAPHVLACHGGGLSLG
jgi:hypothetical protein